MYEFLAPWGVLVPALSAIAMFIVISELRRKQMLVTIEAPETTSMRAVSGFNSSRLA
jgi:hypothetical protein